MVVANGGKKDAAKVRKSGRGRGVDGILRDVVKEIDQNAVDQADALALDNEVAKLFADARELNGLRFIQSEKTLQRMKQAAQRLRLHLVLIEGYLGV